MKAYLLSLVIIVTAFAAGCTLARSGLEEALYMRAWVIRDLLDPPNIVSLSLGVENRGNRFVEFTLRGRPAHDFVVSTPHGMEIWRWTYGKTIEPLLIPKILNPGDYLRFEVKWDQRDNEGRQVHPGKYVVYGLLNVAPDKQLRTPPTQLYAAGSSLTLIPELELPIPVLNPYWRLSHKLPLKLTLKNISDRPVELKLLSQPAYDFIVTYQGQEVWRWSQGKAIEKISAFKILASGEELHYEETYDLQDNKGNPIPPGYYCIRGTLDVEPPGTLEAERCLTIGPGLPLRLTLELPKEVLSGESLSLKLKIENTSDRVLNLKIGYAPYDFIVTTPDNTEVWRWSHGKAFPLMTQPLLLQPGEIKEYSETWDQLDNEGYPIPPGIYFVKGIFRGARLENLFETEQSELHQLIIKP